MYNVENLFAEYFGSSPGGFKLCEEVANSGVFNSNWAFPAHTIGQDGVDPLTLVGEDLGARPIITKSRKIKVTEDSKDKLYWEHRNKNNAAAKRSRDARRVANNQIAERASCLEKENDTLKCEIEKLQQENYAMKIRLLQYENSEEICKGSTKEPLVAETSLAPPKTNLENSAKFSI